MIYQLYILTIETQSKNVRWEPIVPQPKVSKWDYLKPGEMMISKLYCGTVGVIGIYHEGKWREDKDQLSCQAIYFMDWFKYGKIF